VCVVVAAFALLGLGVDVPPTHAGDARHERQLRKELRDHDLELQKLLVCKSVNRKIACRFRAFGAQHGEPPYECEGRAVHRGQGKWKIRSCGPRMVVLQPQAGPDPLFGYNEDWRTHPDKYDLLGASGADVARQTIVWTDLDPPDHTEDFTHWRPYDRIYAELMRRGIRPLWVLFDDCAFGGECPSGVPGLAPDKYDDYARAAAHVARRYPDSAGIEVWNEPNLRAFWSNPDPVAYGELVRMVAPAVDAANPDMPLITAGLFPVPVSDENGITHEEFLRRAYETGGLQAADAIGAHPYPSGGFRDDYLGSVRARLYEQLSVMSEFGDAGKPIWVTETGVSTSSGKDGFNSSQQADALIRIYSLLRRVANLPVVVFHRFVDGPQGTSVEAGYGVVGADGTPKPAYCAVADFRGRPC
jgi:hypothetical protein